MGASESTARSNGTKEEEQQREENNSSMTAATAAVATIAAGAAVVWGMGASESTARSNRTKKEEQREENNSSMPAATIAAGAATIAAGAAVVWGISQMLSNNTNTEERNRHVMEPPLYNTPRIEYEGCGAYEGSRQRSIWSPPPPGCFKLNTDGACRPVPVVGYLSQDSVQRGPSGYGGILRDHRGNWVRGFIGFIGDSDCLTSELHGILKGLEVLDKLNLEGSILETDSQAAYEFVTGDDEYRRKKDIVLASWPIIQKCRQLADKNGISFNLVPGRDANRCADKLADMAVEKRAAYVEFTDLPWELRSLVGKDAKVDG